MFYLIDITGTTRLVKSEPVYQGSINANKVILVAPFASTAVPSVAFTLPNGIGVEGGILNKLTEIGSLPLQDAQGNKYNVWAIDLDLPITQYAGVVRVQFTFSLGSGLAPKSYATQFVVQKGVPSNLPEFNEIGNAEEIFTKIKDYIATINVNVQEATDKAISYVRYITDSKYLLNPATETNIVLSTVPSDLAYKGAFTIAGMTEYLTEEQIENPTLDENADDLFFQSQTNTGISECGFIVDLGEEKEVGIVQMYAWSIWENLTMNAYVSTNGVDYALADSVSFPKTASSGVLDIFRFNINQEARFIKIVQEDSNYTNGSYACKGIEIFAPNIDGYIRIVQNNGNVIEIDSFNAQALVDTINGITAEARTYAESAENSAGSASKSLKDLLAKAGAVGGYPVLEDIDGEAKIPSVYIQQVDIMEYIEITNESELATIQAQVGDVAVLVEDIDGEKTVTKSWLLLSITDSVRNWVIYGTSYATNAGSATYAQSAGNSAKINGVVINKVESLADYNALTDKNGVYFVVIEE